MRTALARVERPTCLQWAVGCQPILGTGGGAGIEHDGTNNAPGVASWLVQRTVVTGSWQIWTTKKRVDLFVVVDIR